MDGFVIDNKAGILKDNEKSVLDIFRERINKAINDNTPISFQIAVGFFFFEGFKKVYPDLKKIYEKGLLREFKLIMGPETKRTTKDVLAALKDDAQALSDESFEFLKELYDKKIFEFRIFLEKSFHIKLYRFGINEQWETWAGSANFTDAGLEENLELIVPTPISTFADQEMFKIFFEELWKKSTDEVENLKIINIIREEVEKTLKSEAIYLEPRNLIINLISLLGKDYLLENISSDISYLGEFQSMSYYLCLEKLGYYGGCILANSFGLGKTDVACLIAKKYKESGRKVLIIYPPVLETHWKTTLEKVGLRKDEVMWLSLGMLQKGDFDYEKYRDTVDLIIVDEAHNFRASNIKSNRRSNLENIKIVNPNSHILLVTATPINTSLLDFTELLKLFIRGNSRYKERFENEGFISKIAEIEKSVKEKAINKETIKKLGELIKKFSVRIEWPDLQIYFKEDLKKIANVEKVEPPDVHSVEYAYNKYITENIFDEVVPFLRNLNFEYTKLWENEYKEDKNLIWWYKWRLYKRLESSIEAFKKSVQTTLNKNEFVLEFLEKPQLEEPQQIKNANLFTKERLENIRNTFHSLLDLKRKEILKRINDDIDELKKMLQRIEGIKDLKENDEKINKLFKVLENEKKPTIIFSESRDTVIYIGEKLKEKGEFKFKRAYGGEVPIDEETGERFGEVNKEEIQDDFNKGKFDILVATDIMGEGVNLQRADVVINFDLHYNPVRLIQRDGRAIRINNPKKISIYNFIPDKKIDKELELCDRVAERIDAIISTIGLDFLIWAIQKGKLEEISEKNRKRTLEEIREYKQVLATNHPEGIYKRSVIPTFSEEDMALKDFVNRFNISKESVATEARKYSKPIYTILKKEEGINESFVVFRYRGSYYTLGNLKFSESKVDGSKLGKEELEKIKEEVSKECSKMDKEFLRKEERHDKLSREVEKIIEEDSELKKVFRDVDISELPKKDKEEILRILNLLEKSAPWEKREQIDKVNNIINRYKLQHDEGKPQIVAVIKYE